MKSFRKKHPILFAIFAAIITIITFGLALLAYLVYNRMQRARALKIISPSRTMDSIELTIHENNTTTSDQLIGARMNSMQTTVSPTPKINFTIRQLFMSVIDQLQLDLAPYKIGFLNKWFKTSEQETEIFNYITLLIGRLKQAKNLPATLVILKQAFTDINNKAKLLPNSAYRVSFRLEQICRTLLARINKIEQIQMGSQDLTPASVNDENIRDNALNQWLTELDAHIKELQNCQRPVPASVNPQEEKVQPVHVSVNPQEEKIRSESQSIHLSSPEESMPTIAVLSKVESIPPSIFLTESENKTDESIPVSHLSSAHVIATPSAVEPISLSTCLSESENATREPVSASNLSSNYVVTPPVASFPAQIEEIRDATSGFLTESENKTDESIPVSHLSSAHVIATLSAVEPISLSTCLSESENATREPVSASNLSSNYVVTPPVASFPAQIEKNRDATSWHPLSRNALDDEYHYQVVLHAGEDSFDKLSIPSRKFICMTDRATFDSYMRSVGINCMSIAQMTNHQLDVFISFLESRAFCIQVLPDEEDDRLSLKR